MEKVMGDLVSVIIPTYNRAGFMPQAIQSVIAQTHKNWELIIVDDGSTDETADIVRQFQLKDKRIRYFYQVNKGTGAARNSGISKSKGNYIAFLDSDDEWLSEKLEKQVNVLKNFQEYVFCYTADKVISLESPDRQAKIKKYRNITDLSFIKLAGIAVSVPSSHMYRRHVFERVGLFDENRELIGDNEDNEWSIRGHFLKGFCLDEPLTVYRIHGNQITKKNIGEKIKNQIRSMDYILQKNIELISENQQALVFRLQQLGHLCILCKEYNNANYYFEKALKLDPFNPKSIAIYALGRFSTFLYKLITVIRNAVRL